MNPAVRAALDELDRKPLDPKVFGQAWSTLMAAQEYRILVGITERAAQRRKDPALYVQAADVAATYLKDRERALECYERALAGDPGHPRALAEARSIYLRQRRYRRAALLLAREENEVRARALPSLVDANGEDIDVSRKLEAVTELQKAHPKDVAVARALAELYKRRAARAGGTVHDTRRAAHILSTAAKTRSGADRVALAEEALATWPGDEAAFVLLEEAGRAEPHKQAFVEANLESERGQQIRKDLADVAEQEGRLRDAIDLLSPILRADPYLARPLQRLYEQTGRVVELDQLLAQAPVSGDADRVLQLKKRAALPQNDRVALFKEVLRIDPLDAEAMQAVDADCRVRGHFEELRDYYAAAARHDPRYLRAVADLSEQIRDVGGAIDAWLVMGGPDAFAALERIYVNERMWSDLVDLYLGRPGKDALLLAARVMRDNKNDLAGAVPLLKQAHDLDPQDEQLALDLYDARIWAGDLEGLEVELRQRAIVADDPARWTQLAKVLDAKGDIDGALEAFRKVRALEPSREEAWLSEESLLDRADRRKELLATLIAHASDAVAAPARARAPILLRAARLALDLGDVDSAVVAAERALEHTREADVLTPLLMDVYDKAGLTAERLATVKALADAMTDAEQQVLVRLRVARAEGAQP